MKESVIMSQDPGWENADWEKITDSHAKQEETSGRAAVRAAAGNPDEIKREMFAGFHEERHQHRKERTAVDAARYATAAIGLTVLSGFVRGTEWIAITCAILALGLGLVAAYGFGKYQKM